MCVAFCEGWWGSGEFSCYFFFSFFSFLFWTLRKKIGWGRKDLYCCVFLLIHFFPPLLLGTHHSCFLSRHVETSFPRNYQFLVETAGLASAFSIISSARDRPNVSFIGHYDGFVPLTKTPMYIHSTSALFYRPKHQYISIYVNNDIPQNKTPKLVSALFHRPKHLC